MEVGVDHLHDLPCAVDVAEDERSLDGVLEDGIAGIPDVDEFLHDAHHPRESS